MKQVLYSLVVAGAFLAGDRPAAAIGVAPVFGSNMVLQRDRPVPVWGTAEPGETVTVGFGGQAKSAKADAQGRWRVALEALPASVVPRELIIQGSLEAASAARIYTNILVGEVWLCSGQSNMGLEVRKCSDAAVAASSENPLIRGFTVEYAPGVERGYAIVPTTAGQRYALSPRETCRGTWQLCRPDTVRNWSGVAYFFARDIQKKLAMPVGIVISSVGATAIEAWISLDGLKAIPAYAQRANAFEEVATAYLADTNRLEAILATQKAETAKRMEAWCPELDKADVGLKAKWMESPLGTTEWNTVVLPVTVEDNPLGTPVGSVWFRREITVPHEWVGKDLELGLGVVDSVDEAYVNGVRVGRTWFDCTNYWQVSRHYRIPAAVVASERVSVALRLVKLLYPMGLFGPAAAMSVTCPAVGRAAPVSLAGAWRWRKSNDLDPGRQPQLAPLNNRAPGNHYGQPGVMYNGMIHPLVPFAIRGVIWYQGEANAPFYVDYRSLLPGLIASWRKEWGQGDFPFGIVQLADYWGQQKKPIERMGYHPLREAQAMALSVTNTFLATAVGVGEGKDIHPKNKAEVGRRLALGALGLVYGFADHLPSGPVYRSMAVEGAAIRITFDYADGLHARGEPPVGFAIAGEDRRFHFAKARIDGTSVVVWSDNVAKPVAVRYAWATNPVCNLYNRAELPVFQFHTDNWDASQIIPVEDEPVTLPAGWVEK